MPKPPDPRYPFPHAWDPGRYSRAYLLSGLSEAYVQQEGVRYLLEHAVWTKIVDAGGKNLRGRASGALRRSGASSQDVQNALRGRTDACQGFPDTHGIILGIPWYVEWKKPGRIDTLGRVISRAGTAEQSQLDFLKEAHVQGALVGVAWSTFDLIAILGKERIQESLQRFRERCGLVRSHE